MNQSKQLTRNRARRHGQHSSQRQTQASDPRDPSTSQPKHTDSSMPRSSCSSPSVPLQAPCPTRDRLEFYSKSADVPPGDGRGEFVRDAKAYTDLANIKSWRSILSNFHMADFEWVGYTWPSIEHAYQGAKMLVASWEAFVAFSKQGKDVGTTAGDGMTLEQAVFGAEGAEAIQEMKANTAMMQRRSASASRGAAASRGRGGGQSRDTQADRGGPGDGFAHIGADTSLAARLARKLVPLSIEQAEFWDSVSRGIMLAISQAKYAQSPLARKVLLATKDAELWHRVAINDPLVRFDHLEELRTVFAEAESQGRVGRNNWSEGDH